MALVNPNIAMSYRGVELPQQNALADYAAVQQIQSGQRQAEVSQMQIDAMRRDDATLKQIQAKSMEKGGPADLDSIADAYLKSGNPKFVEFGIGLRQKLDEKKQFANIMGGKFGAAPAAAAAPASEAYPGYNESIGMAAPAVAAAPASEPYPGYNQAIGMTPSVNAMAPAAAPVTNALADVAMLRQRRDAFLSMGTPQAIAAARALDSDIALASKPPVRQVVSAGSTVLGPDNQVVFTAPAAPTAPPTPLTVSRLIKERDALKPGDPNIAIYNAAIRKETQFAPQADAASRGKAPAGYRYTADNELEPIPGGPAAPGLSPKDIQKREAVFPQATSSVKSFETRSEQFIKELEKLRDDPGLNQITGAIYGRTPSVSREGSRAQSLYDKIFAKGGFQALQDMREASKTGGALGNVSNEEGRRLEKSVVGGLDRTQNIDDVKQGINDFIDEIRVSQARVREAYDTTYSYKGDKTPAKAALSPVDQQALQWANSNPADPRAAAIKQRLGK